MTSLKGGSKHPSSSRAELGDMSREEFQSLGHQLVDWVAGYLDEVGDFPVLPAVKPGSVREQLPIHPPLEPEPLSKAIEDLDRIITPANTHWNHPAFHGYFSITGSKPGILGELVSAAYNVNGMLWSTSPAATELEEVVLGWLLEMLGLPRDWFGIVQDTASTATMCAIAAAREATNLGIRAEGMAGRRDVPKLRMYASEQAHSSVEKGAMILGIGQNNLRKIGVDGEFRMRPDLLEKAIQADVSTGDRPFFVCATVGTTSTTSIDPIPEIADLCEKYGLWLHVDAAYAGSAAILPEMRGILKGCDRADSLVTNPHKWLFTPIDFSAFYSRRPDVLLQTFSLVPEYLRTGVGEGAHNLMDYGISMGRRFRALKFWFVVRAFGVNGLQARIREHLRLGQLLAQWVDDHPDFERMAPTPFSTVCFRAHPRGENAEDRLNPLNEKLLERINASGRAFLSHTKLNGKYALRCAIGNLRTTEERLRETWGIVTHSLDEVANP